MSEAHEVENDPTFGANSLTASLVNQLSTFTPPTQGRITTAWLYQFVTAGTYILFNILALPGELFLRKQFGERYIDPVMLILSYFYLLFFSSIATFASQEESAGVLIPIFAQLYAIVAIYHLVQVKLRNARGEDWHSMSPGIPHAFILRPTQRLLLAIFHRLPPSFQHAGALGFAKRAEVVAISFVEPPLWLAIGILLSIPIGDSILLFWMPTTAAMACKSTLNRFFSRQEILDSRDARLEGEHKQRVMEGVAAPSESKGVTVWSPAMATPASSSPAQATIDLPPDLRAILASKGAKAPPPA